MKKKKKRKSKKILLFVFFSFFVIFVMTFTVGKCWIEIYQKYQEKELLEKKLKILKEKEKKLKLDASKLQNPDYIARYAREKYYYSKDGEIILKIPEE